MAVVHYILGHPVVRLIALLYALMGILMLLLAAGYDWCRGRRLSAAGGLAVALGLAAFGSVAFTTYLVRPSASPQVAHARLRVAEQVVRCSTALVLFGVSIGLCEPWLRRDGAGHKAIVA